MVVAAKGRGCEVRDGCANAGGVHGRASKRPDGVRRTRVRDACGHQQQQQTTAQRPPGTRGGEQCAARCGRPLEQAVDQLADRPWRRGGGGVGQGVVLGALVGGMRRRVGRETLVFARRCATELPGCTGPRQPDKPESQPPTPPTRSCPLQCLCLPAAHQATHVPSFPTPPLHPYTSHLRLHPHHHRSPNPPLPLSSSVAVAAHCCHARSCPRRPFLCVAHPLSLSPPRARPWTVPELAHFALPALLPAVRLPRPPPPQIATHLPRPLLSRARSICHHRAVALPLASRSRRRRRRRRCRRLCLRAASAAAAAAAAATPHLRAVAPSPDAPCPCPQVASCSTLRLLPSQRARNVS
jgi:hypothetical protein